MKGKSKKELKSKPQFKEILTSAHTLLIKKICGKIFISVIRHSDLKE